MSYSEYEWALAFSSLIEQEKIPMQNVRKALKKTKISIYYLNQLAKKTEKKKTNA